MKEPIRVLHILQRMEAGGTQALLMNMYRSIDRQKVQFDFLVHYKEEQFYDEEIQKLGGNLYKFSVREDFNFFKYWKELNQFFKEHTEYTIIHSHMYTLGFIYLLAAKRNGVQVRIAHSHEKDADRDFKYFIKRIMAKLYCKHATEQFACSIQAGEYLFPRKNVRILKNAIDTKKFIFCESIRKQVKEELGIEDKLVIGHIGRFQTTKNHDFLIDIFNHIYTKHSDTILLLIGTGELENQIREKVEKLKLTENVIFLGNRRDVQRLYQAMDVFVLPSFSEGLGIVAIEAQATGLPVVCSDNVPKEAKVTSLVHYLSLEESSEVWAQKILTQLDIHNPRESKHESVIEAGYDIDMVAKEMQHYYSYMVENTSRIK